MKDQKSTGSHPDDESPTAEQMAELAEYVAAWDTWHKVEAVEQTIRELDPKSERELLRQQKEKLAVLMPSVVGADYKAGPPEFDPWAPLETEGQVASAASPPAPAREPPAVAADRGRHIRRRALIDANRTRWDTIERDLRDGAENGLSAAAKGDKHSFWWEGSALKWAEENGKLRAPAGQALSAVVHLLRG